MFKHLFLTFLLAFAFGLHAQDLKVGDVLLSELDCYSCQRIASETGSRFSHSGVVLYDFDKKEMVVAEALSLVRFVSLKSFFERSPEGVRVKVMRSSHLEERLKRESDLAKKLYNSFKKDFEDLLFDRLYLWDRYDDRGRPMLYCSEFVAKFLNPFLEIKLEPSPLDFSQNWDYWFRYYDGDVPQGAPGNSPGSLENAPGFYSYGEFLFSELE